MSTIKAFFAALWEILTLRRWRREEDTLAPQFAKDPVFQSFVAEWTVAIRTNRAGLVLGHILADNMQGSEDTNARRILTTFTMWMQSRSWPAARRGLWPYLEQDAKDTFSTPGAAKFYEELRHSVCESVRDTWAAYVAERTTKN